MNILDTIIAHKKKEVAESKQRVSVAELEKGKFFLNETLSLKSFLLDENKTGIIAEFKRKSPSKGIINDKVTVEEVTAAYAKHGASGISVLTDFPFFGGHMNDLLAATIQEVPLLRKDFMIDEYQLIEAKPLAVVANMLTSAAVKQAAINRIASAPKALASMSWYSSIIKSLRNKGTS